MSEQLDLLPPDACTALHSTMQIGVDMANGEDRTVVFEVQPRQPYGIYGNKFPGVIWPDPKKMQFDIVRDYDPMHMGNRDKALRQREDDGHDRPKRQRDSED